MNLQPTPHGAWAPRRTASPFRDHGAEALRAHAERCAQSRGRWFNVRCSMEAMHGFLAPRFVTTLALASAVLMLCGLW